MYGIVGYGIDTPNSRSDYYNTLNPNSALVFNSLIRSFSIFFLVGVSLTLRMIDSL